MLRTLLLGIGVIAILVLLWIGELPSQATIVRHWQSKAGPIPEALLSQDADSMVRGVPQLTLAALTGPRPVQPANGYYVDGLGRVTQIRLRSAGIRSFMDLPGLKRLKHLRQLDLTDNPLTGDLDFSALEDLEVLSLSRCRDVRVLGLDKLKELKRLTIQLSGIRDRSQVSSLAPGVVLDHLDLSGNPLWPNFDPGWLPSSELLLADTQVESMTYLGAVERLDLSRSRIRRLGGFWRLQTLDLSDVALGPGLTLDGADSLVSLNLTGVALPAGSYRLRFPKLAMLWLRGARNVDLRAIAGLTGLQALILDDSDVRDLGPLGELQSLVILSLRNVSASDFGPVRSLRNLMVLRLSSTRISRLAAREHFPGAVVLFDDSRAVPSLLAPWEQWGLGLAFPVLVVAPFVLKYRPVLMRLGTVLPWQMAKLWRVAGIYALLGYTFTVPLAGVPFTVPPAMLAMELTAAWLAVHTAALLISRSRRFAGATVPLWILTARGIWVWSLFSLPLALFQRNEANLVPPIAWLANPMAALFCVIPVAVLLIQSYRALKPLGGWSGFVRDVAAGRALRLRGTLPAYGEIRPSFRHLIGGGGAGTFAIPNRLQFEAARHELARRQWVAAGQPFFEPDQLRIELGGDDLDLAHAGEFEALRRWLEEVWRHTGAGTWLLGNRAASGGPGTAQRRLAELLPMVTATADSTDAPARASELNLLLPPRTLSGDGLETLLRQSSTLTARLIRQVFTGTQLAERTDLAVRAAETAAAHFALAMTAEYLERKLDLREKDAARLDRPAFRQWLELMGSFRKRLHTPLGASVAAALESAAPPAIAELGDALLRVGATAEQVNRPPTLLGALEILAAARNLTAAHGPLSQRVDEGLYRTLLTSVVATLAALPWGDARLAARSGDGWLAYRGCAPDELNPAPAAAGVALQVPGPDGPRWIHAGDWFQPVPAFRTYAYHSGSEMIDPVAGVRFTTYGGRRHATAV